MARRSKGRRGQRDTSDIANPLGLLSRHTVRPAILDVTTLLQTDRREFHPLHDWRPPGGFVRSSALVAPRSTKGKKPYVYNPTAVVGFADPGRVDVCIRRQQRRAVLHALKRTGKGAGARKRRRNWFSSVRC